MSYIRLNMTDKHVWFCLQHMTDITIAEQGVMFRVEVTMLNGRSFFYDFQTRDEAQLWVDSNILRG